MELYVDQNCFTLDQPSEAELRQALPVPILTGLKSAMSEAGVGFDAWARDRSSFLFVHAGKALACCVRDLCGLRMILLGSDLPDSELLGSDLYALAEGVAKKHGCHLMQWSVPRKRYEKKDWLLPSSFYATNLIFERRDMSPQPDGASSMPHFEQLDFSSAKWKQIAAECEYWVRWTYPGSTYGPLDKMGEVYAEYEYYPKLAEKGIADGIAWKKDSSRAYVLWIRSQPADVALIAMIWIDPSLRNEISGDVLLNAAIARIAEKGFTRVRYFVSAQNVSAMKMLHRSGLELVQYNLNKALT